MRYKLFDEALSYIIVIINMILQKNKQYFVNFPSIHYLCSVCGIHIQKAQKTCGNKYCGSDLAKPGAIGYFIQHSVINQLQVMSKKIRFT
ncbi:hypothetical protein KUTeg_022367 [Tegillarca granosa]|uniref:Uncharacterized protein n=1 Tax=Tegillarca granosa TaxID=220873 RepID=A0ABQ9E605_TEGGR|nr:hypothetical protein KUTeg_022367 [Tegillarca granosa]